MYKLIYSILLVICTGICHVRSANFQNPILDYSSPDPFVLRHSNSYYMVLSDSHTQLFILQSDILTNWRNATKKLIYTAPSGMDNLFAPELHFIDGNFYIYFAMDDGLDENHRMYAVKATNSSDPMGNWSREIRITPPTEDFFAIDGTILTNILGNKYILWSGWPNATLGGKPYGANLYIAPISRTDPTVISGQRLLFREPTYDWEGTVVEAPQIFKRGGITFLIYSAASTWDDTYCLGLLYIQDHLDPMTLSNWVQPFDCPVFWKNDDQNVFGPGHASVTFSPDGTESWLVYHAMDETMNGSNRTARTERFLWNYDGLPVFPRPSGFNVSLVGPSGQN